MWLWQIWKLEKKKFLMPLLGLFLPETPKLNGRNLVQGVNTLAVSLLRYSAAFITWRKWECRLQIGKLGSCLQYIEDCTQSLILTDCISLEKMERFDSYWGFGEHVHRSEERALQVARGDIVDGLETASVLEKWRKRRDCKIGRLLCEVSISDKLKK